MLCEIPIPDGWEFVGYRRADNEFILDGNVPYKFEKASEIEHIIISRNGNRRISCQMVGSQRT